MANDLRGVAVKFLKLPTVNYNNAPIVVINAQQGDVNSRYLSVELYDDRGTIDLTGYKQAQLNATLPSEKKVFTKCIINYEDDNSTKTKKNTITVNIGNSLLEECGNVKCDISLLADEDNKVLLTSKTFYLIVAESQSGSDQVETSEDYNVLLELIKQVEDAEATRQTAEEERVSAENDRVLAEQQREEKESQLQDQLKDKVDSVGGDLKDTVTTFAENATAEAIESGDKTSTIFGKIKAWFSKLKALAFKETIETDDIADKAITREKIADGLIGGSFSVEDATATVKGIATLGSAGGAATYESVQGLNEAITAEAERAQDAERELETLLMAEEVRATAQETDLNDKIDNFIALKGKAGGFASLGADGKVPKSQLPDMSGGGGGGSAVMRKIINNSSNNVSEVKAGELSAVTVNDEDITNTCHVDIYPYSPDTEQFLMTALTTNILPVYNGKFVLALKQHLPAEWSMFYLITEVQ